MASLMGVMSAYENPSKAFISRDGTVSKLEDFKFESFVTE
jgi:hypothetical protein